MAKSEEDKLKLRHYANVVALQNEAEKKTVIELAVQTHRDKIFHESSGKAAAVGATLPKDVTADQVLVHMTFLEQGIPITKLKSDALI